MSSESINNFLSAAVRGESPSWPGDSTVEDVLTQAAFHGVVPLLHREAANNPWPLELRSLLREHALQHAMWELRHQQVLAEMLGALGKRGVQPVLLKGTTLAYSLYDDPALRARGDTDMLIPPEAKGTVHDALLNLGFQPARSVSGEFVSYQLNYTQHLADGQSHTIDLHWKINNSEVLSRLFAYEELWRDSEPLPALCPEARATSRVHALLLACMHRGTHRTNPYYFEGEPHLTADRLIWLYDIHLLAANLSSGEWGLFTHIASVKGLCAVCLEAMQQATEHLGTSFPTGVLANLTGGGIEERPSKYLRGNKLQQQWMDFRAIGSLPGQFRFMGELLFPPADYMRAKFADERGGRLPWLYLRRAAGGVAKRLMPRKRMQ